MEKGSSIPGLTFWFDANKLGWLYLGSDSYCFFFSGYNGDLLLLKRLSSFLSWLKRDGLIYGFGVGTPKREVVDLGGSLGASDFYLVVF